MGLDRRGRGGSRGEIINASASQITADGRSRFLREKLRAAETAANEVPLRFRAGVGLPGPLPGPARLGVDRRI